ncbi:MAG TPA: sigma-70 family RNA polymerase sigma factor [Acidimicrobiales bacterium]|nr:sigma-70 family RNA polymerase sigma factor [Acidimicrobiales bacterium]
MTEGTLTEQFEASRSRLRLIATRMLGSSAEADDAVQETWLRASRSGIDDVDNVEGWLTTIASRVCLDVLRSRTRTAERAASGNAPAVTVPSPEEDAILADAMGPALLVVLDMLAPAERLAFVLHDLFAVPFDEVAAILRRSPAAARQLASRARRRVQGANADADAERERPVVDAFLAAARTGDFAALIDLLDPEVVFRSDGAAVGVGGVPLLVGAGAVADAFKGRAQAAQSALLDGVLGVVVAPAGRLLLVLEVFVQDGRIVEIDAVADPEKLTALSLDRSNTWTL